MSDNTQKSSQQKKREQKIFVPPTIEEIRQYCAKKNISVSPEKFLRYYTESDWHDSRGNPVKNWKLKILTWDSREPLKQHPVAPQNSNIVYSNEGLDENFGLDLVNDGGDSYGNASG